MEETLKQFTTALADAIRTKDGTTAPINPQDFVERILALSNGEPIRGEVRIFYDDTDPASEWGGSWFEDAFPYGTFLMAAGSGGTAGKADTHGNPNGMHTMTLDELVAHNHHQRYVMNATSGWYYANKIDGSIQNNNTIESSDMTSTVGGSKPFDIRPPTCTVHIWRKAS